MENPRAEEQFVVVGNLLLQILVLMLQVAEEVLPLGKEPELAGLETMTIHLNVERTLAGECHICGRNVADQLRNCFLADIRRPFLRHAAHSGTHVGLPFEAFGENLSPLLPFLQVVGLEASKIVRKFIVVILVYLRPLSAYILINCGKLHIRTKVR